MVGILNTKILRPRPFLPLVCPVTPTTAFPLFLHLFQVGPAKGLLFLGRGFHQVLLESHHSGLCLKVNPAKRPFLTALWATE